MATRSQFHKVLLIASCARPWATAENKADLPVLTRLTAQQGRQTDRSSSGVMIETKERFVLCVLYACVRAGVLCVFCVWECASVSVPCVCSGRGL